jgi:hypothetical protein
MCRRAPRRRCMWSIKRTPIRDFYEHAMWERCQVLTREHGCNFRRWHGLTADSGFLQRFCCWARTAQRARAAARGGGARCIFWYVDVGAPCATRPRPLRPVLPRTPSQGQLRQGLRMQQAMQHLGRAKPLGDGHASHERGSLASRSRRARVELTLVKTTRAGSLLRPWSQPRSAAGLTRTVRRVLASGTRRRVALRRFEHVADALQPQQRQHSERCAAAGQRCAAFAHTLLRAHAKRERKSLHVSVTPA